MVSKYGTPLYIVDEATLHSKVNELQDAYSKYKGDAKIVYSVKANFNPSILRSFMKDNIIFDITSLGELYFLKRCDFNPANVIYTSVTEEEKEYFEVLQSGVTRIVVSSFSGMTNLIRVAAKIGVKPKTLIRINPEVGVKAEVRASYRNGKFGVPFNAGTIENASKIVKHIFFNEFLEFDCFHFHLGSQITDFSCFLNTFSKLDSFISKLKKDIPSFTVNTIDIGGGTPVSYDRSVPTPEQMTNEYVERLNQLSDTHGKFQLMIESGRFLVAEAAILVSKIVNTKEYNGHRIVIVDAGYHVLLDSALLKQEYPQEILNLSLINETSKLDENTEFSGIPQKNIHIVGRLCDTYDVFPLSRLSNLNNAKVGNYVSFYNVGAYSIVFNMPFYCQTKPAIVMKTSEGDYKVIRKGTSYKDLFEEEGGSL
ncbi:MAG: diaminopimelate decarboxylase family protein [Nitrososphaeraceae archaeon]